MNHTTKKDCVKFLEEMNSVGLDLKPYVVGMYDRQNYSQTCI